MKAKTCKRWRNFTAVLLAFFVFLAACLSFLLIAEAFVDRDARVLPSYEKVDIGGIISKDKSEWTEDDYTTLSRQTGILSREALDEIDPATLPSFQNALFFEGERRHEMIAPMTPHDQLFDPATGKLFYAPIVNLQSGDIVLTSTCHTFGWRNGHAVIVVPNRKILCSVTPGDLSEVMSFSNEAGIPWLRSATNFMVLRLKNADEETRYQIGENAEKELTGIEYSLLVGIFMKKDQGQTKQGTNCSHLVWQAYKNAGYDIDADGGPVCTSRDISMSDVLEVVQVYGFDPEKLW